MFDSKKSAHFWLSYAAETYETDRFITACPIPMPMSIIATPTITCDNSGLTIGFLYVVEYPMYYFI